MRLTRLTTATLVIGLSSFGATADRDNAIRLEGWFSDKTCARGMLSSDEVRPNGTACVKKCLDEGATAVFVDPKAKAMYDVKGHPSVKEDVGYYLEVMGEVDEKAGTISTRSVKRLGDVVQMCARPRKK